MSGYYSIYVVPPTRDIYTQLIPFIRLNKVRSARVMEVSIIGNVHMCTCTQTGCKDEVRRNPRRPHRSRYIKNQLYGSPPSMPAIEKRTSLGQSSLSTFKVNHWLPPPDMGPDPYATPHTKSTTSLSSERSCRRIEHSNEYIFPTNKTCRRIQHSKD